MARKNLLTEGEIHRFMKLANMNPVGDGRLKEMGMPYGARDEEEALESELSDMDSEADREGDEIEVFGGGGGWWRCGVIFVDSFRDAVFSVKYSGDFVDFVGFWRF